jgi:hippurate hydrolase
MLKIKEFDNAIDALLPEIIEIRQELHAHPELSLKEYRTSDFIRSRLEKLDVEILPPFLSTDVVALLGGTNHGNNVTLRADIDALPMIEENTFPYCSNNRGVMHACGHDGHTAMLLGAAMILERYKDQLEGSVRFVFQPGEEVVAAGKDLVAKGMLTHPIPGAVLALHGWPGYPTGAICSKSGDLMAAADFYKIKIKGGGGHGSRSDQQNNPIVLASQIVSRLTSIPEREFSQDIPVVISISKLSGGTASNVLPGEVTMEGSTRYFSESAGERIPALFEEVLRTACMGTKLNYELAYDRPYIATVNDPGIVHECKRLTEQFMGASAWIDIQEPVMSSEDFSYYISGHPGGMFFLGMGEDSPGLHTNTFDFNDQALKNGIKFLVISAWSLLSGDVLPHGIQ